MLTRATSVSSLLLFGLLLAAAPAPADEDIQPGKTYRVVRTDGREIVGEVTDLPNVYKVKVGTGITMTIRKSEVRDLILVEEEESPDKGGSLHRQITDAEIEEILGSESVEDLYVWDYVQPVDLMPELPLNRESLDVMLGYAKTSAKAAQYLETPHFVCVYTSERASALRLVQRLEIVYRWNATFVRLFNIPVKRPEHKLELFHFGTYEEFVAYATLCGHMAQGAAGFYMRTNNRCAFFEQDTYPQIVAILEALRDRNVPYQTRRRFENELERWSNYINLMVVQHEATHAIHFNIGVFPKRSGIGSWMVEGLCVQFEVAPTREGGSFGKINYFRLDSFHKMYMSGDRVVVPWQFVRNLILVRGSGIHDYVMGWALNYYLRKVYKEKYAKWMQLLAAEEDAWNVEIDYTAKLADFEGIFGRVDEEWVQQFYDYIAAIPVIRSEIPEFPDGLP